jgi:hypothetical protein
VGWLKEHRWIAAAVALVLLAGATTAAVLLSRTTEHRLAWQPVEAGGVIPTGVTLTALSCPAPDDCWAAGTSPTEGKGFLARLHDGAWQAVPADAALDLDRATDVSCRAVNDCWATSPSFTSRGVWHFDGTQWTVLEPELDADLRPLVPAGEMACQPGGTCVATAGRTTDCQSRASVWDGRTWRPTPTTGTSPCLRTVACPAIDRCDGFGLSGGDQPAPVRFRVDGDSWQTVTEAARRSYLPTAAVSSCPAAGRCAVLYSAALNRYRPWAEVGMLDGEDWRDPAAVNAGLPESLYATGLACTSLSHCLLVGADTTADSGAFHATAYQWDGTQWTVLGLPDYGDGSMLNAVACPDPDTCWAVGTDSSGDTLVLRATPG